MGNTRKSSDPDKVQTDGDWVGFALRFLQSRACAELSPHGIKLLIDLVSMLKPNAGRNGDIWPSVEALKVRGWTSVATIAATMHELRTAGLVVTTRQRRGRRCELVALTLWPLHCDQKKLDIMRYHYSVTDYRGDRDAMLPPPTPDRPAVWKKVRPATGNQKTISPSGNEKPIHPPQRERDKCPNGRTPPATGTRTAKPPP